MAPLWKIRVTFPGSPSLKARNSPSMPMIPARVRVAIKGQLVILGLNVPARIRGISRIGPARNRVKASCVIGIVGARTFTSVWAMAYRMVVERINRGP